MKTGEKRVKGEAIFCAAVALTAFLLLAPRAARAQWTTTSSNGTTATTTTNAVGVGTAAPPPNLFTVWKDQAYSPASGVSSMTQVQVRNDSASGFASFSLWSGTERGRVQFNAANPNLFLTSRGAVPLYLGTNDSIRLAVDGGTGNVGVGTTSPANALHVHSAFGAGYLRVSGAGLGAINFQDTAAPANQQLYQWRSEGGSFRLALVNDSVTAFVQPSILVANPAGNVGVGTASPGNVLTVRRDQPYDAAAGVGSMTQVQVRNDSASGFAAFSLWSGAERGRMQYNAGDPNLFFTTFGAVPFHLGTNNAVRLTIDGATGNVGIGAAPDASSRLSVAGAVSVAGSISASQNLSVGGTVTGGNFQATYQDVAEWVPSSQKLSAGTVVVLDTGETNHVVASVSAYDTKVAGVVSAEPGVILGVGGEGRLKVATTGRVRVKADASRGAIRVGDLLVTSGVEGAAMKSVPVDLGGVRIHRPGTIIGKALEPLERGTGEILVLLSLQ